MLVGATAKRKAQDLKRLKGSPDGDKQAGNEKKGGGNRVVIPGKKTAKGGFRKKTRSRQGRASRLKKKGLKRRRGGG